MSFSKFKLLAIWKRLSRAQTLHSEVADIYTANIIFKNNLLQQALAIILSQSRKTWWNDGLCNITLRALLLHRHHQVFLSNTPQKGSIIESKVSEWQTSLLDCSFYWNDHYSNKTIPVSLILLLIYDCN